MLVEGILVTIVGAATPIALAAIGELVVERSGVLNLGVEGMMIMGAVVAFGVALGTGNPYLGIVAGALAGVAMSLLFGLFTVYLATNQVATGLALTLFGLGLAGLIGESFVGTPGVKLQPIPIPLLADLPIIGPALFARDVIVYASFAVVAGVSYALFKTRAGLVLRATGENAEAAHALGRDVRMIRMAAVAFGGACAGIGGAYLSLVLSTQWTEGMTAGRGWIALAIVVFATWLPWRALAGAYLFGGVIILQLHAQALGVRVPPQAMTMLPYIATIVALILLSRNQTTMRKHTPAALGRAFVPDR
ncbi:MAG: ABC transporter permease [Devosiaceae bacterium]|nr:ABC transporter permease [Devosiaceae bacterium MH13]